ncbi:hypothetical protein [Lunatibacter salilacus]|uniref:hypothetical protein n=1 Tax=Lunatibacter salilacus TaxID=2483804 RepID=UPI00131DC57F|nr:hypothetical protein [Lunatibacter salilacus]
MGSTKKRVAEKPEPVDVMGSQLMSEEHFSLLSSFFKAAAILRSGTWNYLRGETRK